jgi:hypothetical protein
VLKPKSPYYIFERTKQPSGSPISQPLRKNLRMRFPGTFLRCLFEICARSAPNKTNQTQRRKGKHADLSCARPAPKMVHPFASPSSHARRKFMNCVHDDASVLDGSQQGAPANTHPCNTPRYYSRPAPPQAELPVELDWLHSRPFSSQDGGNGT